MKRLVCLLCGVLLLVAANCASAASISYSDSVALTVTNWNTPITIQKFDTSLGTLTSIQFDLSGHVEGMAKFESLDSQPATVYMWLQAIVKLQRPGGTDLVTTLPVATTTDSVTAFDTVIDYGGTSGKTYDELAADNSNSATTSLPSDLTLFSVSGVGYIYLPMLANGASTGSGAGNLLLGFATSASGSATVTYFYDPVPEPSSLLALLSGFGGIMGLVRRRR